MLTFEAEGCGESRGSEAVWGISPSSSLSFSSKAPFTRDLDFVLDLVDSAGL